MKLRNKTGGIKEVLYDNIGIFIVIVLIVVTLFAASKSINTRGTNNKENMTTIETSISGNSFDSSTKLK